MEQDKANNAIDKLCVQVFQVEKNESFHLILKRQPTIGYHNICLVLKLVYQTHKIESNNINYYLCVIFDFTFGEKNSMGPMEPARTVVAGTFPIFY